ncbi:MAG TPA: hypothetical protein VLA16_07860 [Ideonella sp.]|nr:hypothetical protein [Ideonella sp.]
MPERYTKDSLPTSFGTLKPVGYVMAALPSAEAAAQAAQALTEIGFSLDDVLYFTPSETTQDMEAGLRNSSEAAGFGYEITLMRRFHKLAAEGYRWLLIYAPQREHEERIKDTLAAFGAATAVKYNRLTVEELI